MDGWMDDSYLMVSEEVKHHDRQLILAPDWSRRDVTRTRWQLWFSGYFGFIFDPGLSSMVRAESSFQSNFGLE